MRTFVTGGSGFVGRELIGALVARGHEVVALARSEGAADAVRRAGATPVRGDVTDGPSLVAGMHGCTGVIHAAANVQEWGTRAAFEAVNVAGTANVLAAAKQAGASRVLLISTEAVLLGSGPIRQADETRSLPARATGVYADTKNAAERLVRAANGSELATLVVRPRLVWGRGDTSLLPQLVASVEAGRFAWIGGGHHPTSTCHVQNLADGAIAALERGAPGGVWFLSDGAPSDFRDFITALLATQGVAAPTRSVPRWLARAAATTVEGWWRLWRKSSTPPVNRTPVLLFGEEVTVDDRRARAELGYAPRMSVADGLAEMRRLAGR